MAESFKYLVSTEEDVRYGISVTTVGSQTANPGDRYPVSSHPEGYMFNPVSGRVLNQYQIIYIADGQGRFTDGSGCDYHVKSGSVMIVFPNEWHSYCPDKSTGWKEYFIGAKGPVLDEIMNAGFLTPENPVLSIGLSEKLVSLYREALQIANDGRPSGQQYLSGILMHILGYVLSASKTPEVKLDEMTHKIEMAKIYINEQACSDIDLAKLPETLMMSYSSFRKMFKQVVGMPPGRYIQEARLREACRMLTNTNASVKYVSNTTRFKSVTLFNCIFKKRIGQTPLEYRRKSRAGLEDPRLVPPTDKQI